MRCDDLLYLALASPLRITTIAEVAMTGVPKLGVSLRWQKCKQAGKRAIPKSWKLLPFFAAWRKSGKLA